VRRAAYFTSGFFGELRKLARKASDLPAEVLRVLPLTDSGELTMKEVTASTSRSWIHYCFRLGSKTQSMGKREGYRVHAIVGRTEIRLFTIYEAHHKRHFISEDEKKAIKKALEKETVSDLGAEWFTCDDLVETFISGADLGEAGSDEC